jgi:murein DD-endopeptidase MepM/ murein hydrolase activator NlpD
MAKIKYYYDTETCKYEEVKTSKKEIATSFFWFTVLAFVFAVGMVIVHRHYFPSSRETALLRENQELLLKYALLDKEMKGVNQMMAVLRQRDDNVYRVIFEAEPIATEIRQGGTGGTEKYKDLLDERLRREDLIVGTYRKVDNLKKQMYVQTKSYDELMEKAKAKAEMLACIPAIRPVPDNDLTLFVSGFGMRIHPIYKVRKMHTGCDFAASTGAPIYSTGDGKVVKATYDGGYGMTVEIDHGYGYVTKYAHMSGYSVRLGQKVKRGQQIGKVGSTGTSVSPHLHYEVIYNGIKVNPVNYFFNDLSPDQYKKMLELAAEDRQSLG